MTTFVALLRAVNVGGTGTLPMAELKSLCEKAGFTDVRTYIQSGNVVFGSSASEAEVKSALEAALLPRMKKHTEVLVRSAEAMADMVAGNPFSAAPGNRVAVLFLDRAPAEAALAGIAIPGREEIHPAGREVYVHYPDGMGRSKLNLSKLGAGTARNINTVAKLAAMAKG